MNSRLSAKELELLGERVGELLDRLEAHPDERVRQELAELLDGIDRLHREALLRILPLVREVDPDLERLAGDPVARLVLSLYDLLPATVRRGSAADVIPLVQVHSAPAGRGIGRHRSDSE